MLPPSDPRHDPAKAPAAPFRVRSWALGPWATNCYALEAGEGPCWIIDPGYEPGEVVAFLRERSASLRPGQPLIDAIILTHAHMDHLGGLPAVLSLCPASPILIHEAEAAWLGDPELNLSAMAGLPVSVPGPTATLRDGQRLTLGNATFEVRHTPGHSPGSITLWNDASGLAIVGDALFAGSIGRTDLPGGDMATLERSIRQRLYTLPDHARVLPGHGPPTTIGQEKRTNPYVRPTGPG